MIIIIKKKKIPAETLLRPPCCDTFPYAALLPFRVYFNNTQDTGRKVEEHLHLDSIVGFYMDCYLRLEHFFTLSDYQMGIRDCSIF